MLSVDNVSVLACVVPSRMLPSWLYRATAPLYPPRAADWNVPAPTRSTNPPRFFDRRLNTAPYPAICGPSSPDRVSSRYPSTSYVDLTCAPRYRRSTSTVIARPPSDSSPTSTPRRCAAARIFGIAFAPNGDDDALARALRTWAASWIGK